MFTNNFARIGGLCGISAGMIWIGLLLVELLEVATIFDGEPWDYLGLLAVTLFLLAVIGLYSEHSRNLSRTVGQASLTISALAMGLSVIYYMLEVDPEDGAAFQSWLLSTILLGLGLVLLGNGLQSRSGVTTTAAVAKVLGALLTLVFPGAFLLFEVLLDVEMDAVSGLIWGSVMVMQAISWIIVGRITFANHGVAGDRPAQLTG